MPDRDPRDMNLQGEMAKFKEAARKPSVDSPHAAQVNKADDADPDPPTHKPEHVRSLIDGLKGLLGIDHTPVMGEKNSANADTLKEAGVGGAMNKGISDGTGASNEY